MRWWVYQNGEISSQPYSEEQLVQLSGFTGESLICKEGTETWCRARDIPRIKTELNRQTVKNSSNPPLKCPPDFKKDQRINTAERVKLTQEILNLVANENYRYGLEITASLLAGELDERLISIGLTEHPHFGFFDNYQTEQLRIVIHKLINCQLLEQKIVAGDFEVLELTPLGNEILQGAPVPNFNLPRY